MDLLIDTHAVIWFITDSNRLPTKTKHLIENHALMMYSPFLESGNKN